ncbi:MAG: RodZ domain-containing protein [Elusimicrobiota bacterium]
MDIGSKLKEKRQDLGLSLDDISVKTLINVKYLNAIEENGFSDIPTAVMVFGFLRNYSVVLGLNSDEIIAEYKKSNPVQFPKVNVTRVGSIPITKTKTTKTAKITSVLIIAIGVIIAISLVKIISTIVKSNKTSKPIAVQQTVKKNCLEIQTSENVWIRIKEDGNPIFEGIVPSNTKKIFESTGQFNLRIGNIPGVIISLNGVPIELPTQKLITDINLP